MATFRPSFFPILYSADAGVPVLVEPTDQPWNERLAYVEDPDGNPVMITAPIK